MVRVVQVQEGKVVAALNSEPARRILSHCVLKPLSVKEISARTGIPLPSAYRHVRGLVEDGLLYVERSAMTEDGKPYDLYRSVLKRCRIEMVPERIEVTWEMNASIDERLLDMWKALQG